MNAKANRNKTDGDIQTFEQAMARLEELVEQLESGDVPLEESVRAFEEGQKLVGFCRDKLKSAEKALKELKQETDDVLDGNNPDVQ